MGAVYCATQKSPDRTVAIKILPRELSANEAFRDSFVAGSEAMARLNHPNLIGVYDYGEVDGMLFIIMEFVPGLSIHHSAHGIAIDPLEVIRIVSSICHGLAHAHENGIMHCDIMPTNILLDCDAQPKIGDFGLARPFERMVHEGDEINGTLDYTAPEVIHPPYVASYRADIYSVGIMLHELLTGSLPTPDQQTASSIVHCDARFDAIIRRATEPEPDHRYSNANEMANDLIVIANSQLLMPAANVSRVRIPARQVTLPVRRMAHQSSERIIQKETKSSRVAGFLQIILAVVIAISAYVQYQKNNQPRVTVIKEPAVRTLLQKKF